MNADRMWPYASSAKPGLSRSPTDGSRCRKWGDLAMGEIRPGGKTRETVLETDELYGQDGLRLGPRGRDYGVMLPHPRPYQHANLCPDPNSSCWVAFLEMPEGSVLNIRGRYPYGRSFQLA